MRALEGEGAAARVLAYLRAPGSVTDHDPVRQRYVILPRGDRRRRPIALAGEDVVAALISDGALERVAEGRFAITSAGRARSLRALALADESYRAQHDRLADRSWVDGEGAERRARGVDGRGLQDRLRRLGDASGRALLTDAELAAAQRLRDDWEVAQQGMVKGSDWSAPPRGASQRGPSNGAETARLSVIDARRRLADAFDALAPAMASAVRSLCLLEKSLADIERAERWPRRSGKLALKMGLAQLAQFYARR
jgi:hypothetical protein